MASSSGSRRKSTGRVLFQSVGPIEGFILAMVRLRERHSSLLHCYRLLGIVSRKRCADSKTLSYSLRKNGIAWDPKQKKRNFFLLVQTESRVTVELFP